MTTPGDSDEWWKQYGGEGVTPETPPVAPPQPAPPPAGYTSAVKEASVTPVGSEGRLILSAGSPSST